MPKNSPIITNTDLYSKLILPDKSLTDFVEGFWFLQYQSSDTAERIIVPDGKIDLLLSKSTTEAFHITLIGLETKPKQFLHIQNATAFAISFKPLAAEYILQCSIAHMLNGTTILPNDFWNFNADDLNDFDLFCQKATQKIQSLLPKEIDMRKQKLFDLIYSSNGAITVKELSKKVFWSSRQINRYFQQQFGLSLKAYCNIFRFRSSFPQIVKGELYPEQNFSDQAHFSREIKKLSSVTPKELSKNKNDRFIQFSALRSK